ncbi:CHAP domain-containing protein [Ruminococcus albus]|uniref:CHAP domain-containing protein n=1 Tax=Ruminococcus albus TaxID=1264 RepID=A0A1H7GVZ5_RUMAL|nr:CHAP domain-containing protein [Ruminococcus albus]SEK41222.1 CHAP domain-containing protein [Ruminococcus albus]
MKKMNFKKAIATLTVVTAMISNVAVLPASAATYGTREKVVEVAEKYLNAGANAKSMGFSDQWCALFAHKCVTEAGGKDYSSSASTTSTLLDYRKAGKYHAKRTTSWSYGGKSCPALSKDTNYTPKVGDIALIENNNNWSDGPDHTVLVVRVEGTGINATIYTIEGNLGGTGWWDSHIGRDYWCNQVWGYCSPDYSDSSNSQKPTSGVGNYSDANVKFSSVTYPIKQKAGSTFSVYGTIQALNGKNIKQVVVDIDEKRSNGSYVNVDRTTRTMNTASYNLHSIDDRIWFNRASKANTTYRYKITVTTSNGKVASFTREFKTF